MNNYDATKECPVCLEEIQESKHTACTQCVYTICEQCFDSLHRKRCPYCRTIYPGQEDEKKDDGREVNVILMELELEHQNAAQNSYRARVLQQYRHRILRLRFGARLSPPSSPTPRPRREPRTPLSRRRENYSLAILPFLR